MGRAVAAALGATTRRTGYLEGASDLVTWCVGHLVELDAQIGRASCRERV